ncbi:MAG: carboxymuconolactone decarboxylase family protein [Acidimicrobiales bacterium]
MAEPQSGGANGRRLTPLRPEELDDDQRRVYQAITAGPRASGQRYFPLADDAGRLHGPFDAMLRSAPVGLALQELGAALRYGTELPPRLREIVILAVAAAEDSAFERYAHEAIAKGVGLSDRELAAIREAADLVSGDPVEAAGLKAARMLVADGDLDDETFASLLGALGERRTFELTTLVGYYKLLALQLRVFRVPLPDTKQR